MCFANQIVLLQFHIYILRKRGRPKETLKRTLLREAGNIGLSSMEEIERVAQDRAVWRNYLQALCNVQRVNETHRIALSVDESQRRDENIGGKLRKMKYSSSSTGNLSHNEATNQNRLSHMMELYEDVVGLTEVKSAQEKVVHAEQQFLQVQEDRRAMQQELVLVQADVRAVGAELEKTSRTDTRYIDLVKKEHEALLIEKEMINKIKTLDKAERDFFALLSAALRESHEKERARAEKTKYWSIIGSIIGAIIGIVGSTFNNYKRMKELRAIVTESGENTEEYKTLANKMVETVFAQQSKIEEFVGSISHLEHSNNKEKVIPMDHLFVNYKDFNQHTEMMLAALQSQSETVLKHLSELQVQFSINKANENNEQVVYVGPDMQQMFLSTEQKLQTELQRNRWATAAAFGGLLTISLCVFLLKGSI